jgi:hypothetical protein
MMTVVRLARIIVLLTLVAGLAACSAIKLGYNTLGEVAYWWLDSYLDFTDAQAPLVRQDLARLHAWHRHEELPRFVQMQQRMEQLAPRDIRPEEACSFVPEFRERLLAVANQAEPATVALATGLKAEQLQHLRRKYEKNNANYTGDWIRLPRAEQHEKRYHQFLERAEMIYGSLGDAQREALRRDIDQSSFDPQRILAQRQRRQQDLLATLGRVSRPGVTFEEARRLMRGYFDRAVTPPDAKERAEQEQLIAQGCRHFAVLHNSTTLSQRDNAVRRLRAYQRELRELSADQ